MCYITIKKLLICHHLFYIKMTIFIKMSQFDLITNNHIYHKLLIIITSRSYFFVAVIHIYFSMKIKFEQLLFMIIYPMSWKNIRDIIFMIERSSLAKQYKNLNDMINKEILAIFFFHKVIGDTKY